MKHGNGGLETGMYIIYTVNEVGGPRLHYNQKIYN